MDRLLRYSDLMERAYFDHAATTPLDPRVLEAMVPALQYGWGNPSGIYREAQYAAGLLDRARDEHRRGAGMFALGGGADLGRDGVRQPGDSRRGAGPGRCRFGT